MKTIKSIDEAKAQFVEQEEQLHRFLTLMFMTHGTKNFAKAKDTFQGALREYTDACRVWGAAEGIAAWEHEQGNITLDTYDPAPAKQEMH